jgi:hypothetical protein
VGNGMRALKVLTVVMGVMILVGTAVLVAVIIHRASSGPAASASVALVLNEPAGTRIAGIAAAGDRLALQLQGGGADRVVLVDPRSGVVVGRIMLGR